MFSRIILNKDIENKPKNKFSGLFNEDIFLSLSSSTRLRFTIFGLKNDAICQKTVELIVFR